MVETTKGSLLSCKFTFAAAALMIGCITFAAYLPALQNGFVNWDDGEYIYENQKIQSIDSSFFKWVFTSEVSNHWHPLTLFSYALDYAIWEFDPYGYHFTSVIIHTFNTLLVFLLSVKLIEYKLHPLKERRGNIKPIIAGVVTSLLFGIHPLHVESVAWVSERKDVLYAFFFLLSILAYIKYTSSKYPQKSLFYIACLIFFTMALMSKSMAMTLPIVLLIMDIHLFRNISEAIIEKIPFFLLSLLSSFAAIAIKQLKGELYPLEGILLTERIASAGHAIIFYLLKMILPFNLATYYPRSTHIGFFSIEYMGCCSLFLLITFLAILSWKKNKIFLVVWSYYLVTILPVIGIIQFGVQSIADRYTYLPSLGPFFLVGLGVASVFKKHSKKQYIVIIVPVFLVTTIMIVKTGKQISIWKNSITLWSHNIRLFPDTADIAYNNRGIAYNNSDNYKQAIHDFNKAIEIDPQYTDAYLNRGNVYDILGNPDRAIVDFNMAIDLNPQYTKVYYNRGTAYNNLGSYQLAIADFSKVIDLNPEYAEAYNNRGIAYSSLGNHKQAIADYSKAIGINPEYAEAYNNRGVAYGSLANYQQAMVDFNKTIEISPQNANAYNNIGEIYSLSGNTEQAQRFYNKAKRLGLR